ncbi:hypothetical protein GOV05_03715, partial [Candidatus Woesearchaeota archaeon]|nr:hypothetical protein [Candidatus Woesearchaeota archaeon]
MNKKTALPIFVILLLVSFVSADINNPNINVGVNYAEINWTSTSLEAGQVFWGEVIPSNTEQETTPTLAHSVRINNLDPSTTYFYRVHSGTDYYPGISSSNNFTTLQAGVINQNRIRLTLDQNLAVTTYSNQTTYAISGTTETDTRIRVYRYLNGLPNQVGMTLPGGSVVYRIDTPLSGEFEFEISLVEGANDFMIEFLNPITYDREQRNFSVTADFTEPNAQFVSLRTDYSQETYKLLGVTDTNTTFEVFVDGAFKQRITLNNPTTNTTNYFTSQGLFLPLSYLYFNTSVNVGVDGLHNLSFVFTDMAGNVNTVNIDDIFFDSEEPEIINISISTITDAPISAELWTPFNPVTIRGYVSDNSNSKLTVIIKNAFNNSRFSFDDELEENDQGGFDHSLFTQVPGMWSTLLGEDGDVITLNGNGWFELDLYLMAPNILDEPPETKKDNNVFFRVVDQAGNIEDDYETITYEPTSTVWGINTQETDPNEIYSSWLIHADYPAQLMFELVFHESVNFEDIELLNINFLPLDDGYDQITKELRIRMDDAQANLIRNDDLPGYLVILPFELAQNRDANELLYEKDSMQFNIKLEIDYSYKKEGQPKQTQYVQAVFSPQTPYDFSKFLTPEIVRNTLIPTFTDARDFVGKLSNFTYDNIIKPGLPICVVLMAYNAVKNYVNPLETFTASTNDPALKLMKVVCDRIFCPVVPPKGPNDDSVLGYSPNVGSQFNDLGVYREGGFLNRRETPCNPTVVNFGNTVNPIQSALMTTQQVGVYTVNSLATGLSTKRCYSNSYPFYDDLKCLFNKGGGDTDKNPMRDLVDSVQCGCAGGFYLQTQRIVRHLDEVLDCLEKLENGDVDAGYCEAILATSACELFQYVFEKIIEKRYDTKMYSTRDAVGKLTLSEMKNSYGDAITRVTAGEFTAASIVHKSCMLALGMDISDFNALLDNAIGAQDVEPKVGPVVVQSHLNSVNEADRTLQIQYKYTPYIQAGLGSDVTAKLIMFCDPEGIDSEYCPLRRDESVKINLGQIAKGTTLSTTGVYNDAPDAKVWYNKAFIEYTYRDRVLEDIDSVEYRCVPNNSCIGAGGSLQPGYEASLGCSSEQEACGFRTITSQATPEYVTKTTEPFDIIHRGGIKFGCIFDLNTYGGFYCGLGDESLPSANMELEDAAMAQAGTFYQGQDVVAFLTLNKRQFNKENFIVRYEIMDRNGNPRGDGLEIFNTQEVFKCPFGGVGETPELVLPVT